MYAKPLTRALDAAIAQASCTPCAAHDGNKYTIYVSADYTQAYGQGFCSPIITGTPGVGIDIGQYVAALISGIEIKGDGAGDSAAIGVFLP